MKFLIPLLFLAPTLSFGSVVPPQIPAQLNSGSFYLSESFVNTTFSDLLNGSYFCPPYLDSSYNRILVRSFASDYYYDISGPGGGSYFGTGLPCTDSSNLISYYSISTSSLASIASSYPGFDFIYTSFIFCSSPGGCDISASSTVIGYMKFRFNGTNWVDALGAGASGSWEVTASSTLPIDFTDFAQGLKDAIANNTVAPVCTYSDLLSSEFWSGCVATSIFNWLFIPSDSAIDYMIAQMSNATQYGSSFVYILLAPVLTSVGVASCDADDPSACSVGTPLTIPILDVHGSSTDYVLDPISPIPDYVDAFFASIVGTLIIIGVSYSVLSRFM